MYSVLSSNVSHISLSDGVVLVGCLPVGVFILPLAFLLPSSLALFFFFFRTLRRHPVDGLDLG